MTRQNRRTLQQSGEPPKAGQALRAARLGRGLRQLAGATAALLLSFSSEAFALPTVNGLFYGDGDFTEYIEWNTSYYNSKLYIFYDAPSTTLYAALVVDRSVNDNVFTANPPDSSGYMASAGWGGGGGQQRDAGRLTDSEFATFTLECAPSTGERYEWQQGYACPTTVAPPAPPSNWVSDLSCPASLVITDTTGNLANLLVSASSFATNANTYQTAPAPPQFWNMYLFGNAIENWKSPFDALNPSTVIGLDGYPAPTDPTDLSQGPTITYSNDHEWEWPMVYEWSINLAAAGCGSEAVFLVTGLSHHSPMKTGAEGLFDEECGEENDCFPPNGSNPLSDLGDLPDTYGTLLASNGARHQITSAGPFLGSALDPEADGSPDASAEGDDNAGVADEDGVTANLGSNWTPGSTQSFTVVASGTGVLAGWFDWNGDGDLSDAGEYFTANVVAGTNTLDVVVGAGFDWQLDSLNARFRLFSSQASAPGGSLDAGDSVGLATDGEVEDYTFGPGSLPVTLNAFTSELKAGSALSVRWQTATETDNVGFELWGHVGEEWLPLGPFVPSAGMNSDLPQSYETEVFLPAGLTALELVNYDTHGRPERFGPFRPGAGYGEFQPVRRIDWTRPREEREARLRSRGFGRIGLPRAATATGPAEPQRWRKLTATALASAPPASSRRSLAATYEVSGGGKVRLETGPLTHVAVTEAGIQRVGYESLRDAGLDLAGVRESAIAVTWRGEPVARWIHGRGTFGPGSWIEFVGQPPQGDDALYLAANLYQVSLDPDRARPALSLGSGRTRRPSEAYQRTTMVDRPITYHRQSPTGDPWVEGSVLVRGSTATRTLEIPVAGPVLPGPVRLIVGLGTVTDLPDIADAGGEAIPEHNVEIWFGGPGSDFEYVTSASAFGQQDWRIEADLPPGALQPGVNRLQLRFDTDYFFSLVLIDRYGVSYPSPYLGPELDFDRDPAADGYRVEGLAGSSIVAYAEGEDGGLTRIEPRVLPSGGGYAAELRQLEAARFWMAERPHRPTIFTTDAPADLLVEPGELLIIAGSSFVGTPALDAYLAERSAFRPVVIDVEDIFNGIGFGMALPDAITDYLRIRSEILPFSHVQLVGADCYDRLNRLSDCVSFIPLPTARVGVTVYTPSQNRLVDLDGDGVGDKAVGQFSVRDEAELATIVAKGAAWTESRLTREKSALLIAEETDGIHDFAAQIERLRQQLAWSATDLLDMADHPDITTARAALRSSLDQGRALTVFSGHSSPGVWAFRSLLTASGVAELTNFGLPTVMVPLACETTYDISPDANVLGHQLLYAGEQGALAISGAVALSSLDDNERMARLILDGLEAGLTLGEAVQAGRETLGSAYQTLQDNWLTQGDVAARLAP